MYPQACLELTMYLRLTSSSCLHHPSAEIVGVFCQVWLCLTTFFPLLLSLPFLLIPLSETFYNWLTDWFIDWFWSTRNGGMCVVGMAKSGTPMPTWGNCKAFLWCWQCVYKQETTAPQPYLMKLFLYRDLPLRLIPPPCGHRINVQSVEGASIRVSTAHLIPAFSRDVCHFKQSLSFLHSPIAPSNKPWRTLKAQPPFHFSLWDSIPLFHRPCDPPASDSWITGIIAIHPWAKLK